MLPVAMFKSNSGNIYVVILLIRLSDQIDAFRTSLYIQSKYHPIEDHIYGRHSAFGLPLHRPTSLRLMPKRYLLPH